jgi:hypothetical protein
MSTVYSASVTWKGCKRWNQICPVGLSTRLLVNSRKRRNRRNENKCLVDGFLLHAFSFVALRHPKRIFTYRP